VIFHSVDNQRRSVDIVPQYRGHVRVEFVAKAVTNVTPALLMVLRTAFGAVRLEGKWGPDAVTTA